MIMVVSDIIRFLCWTVPVLLVDGIRLAGFVLLLAPGFCRFLYYYAAVAQRVTFSYGTESCRQTLDIYFPPDNAALYDRAREYKRQMRRATATRRRASETTPNDNHTTVEDDTNQHPTSSSSLLGIPTVVIASGGAWLIGYKMRDCLLARALTARGIIVVLLDYRNYPWGTVPAMVTDVDQAVEWVLQHVEELGGDKSQVILSGQSAGGHLGFMALVRRVLSQSNEQACREDEKQKDDSKESNVVSPERSETVSWKPSDLSGFVSLSGPLHLATMEPTFRRHGLHAKFVERMFDGDPNAHDAWSVIQNLSDAEAVELASALPPLRFYHGSSDRTVPCEGSATFVAMLQERLQRSSEDLCLWHVYDGWSHTDAILEGPMQGDHRFHDDLVQAVADWTGFESTEAHNDTDRPLCPKLLVRCAKVCMPF